MPKMEQTGEQNYDHELFYIDFMWFIYISTPPLFTGLYPLSNYIWIDMYKLQSIVYVLCVLTTLLCSTLSVHSLPYLYVIIIRFGIDTALFTF